MFSAKVQTTRSEKPFELILGDGCYYEHEETGREISLFRYSKGGEDSQGPVLHGVDKHGRVETLTLEDLYTQYKQKRQSDFTDPVDPRLPYVFDLFYDVKTLSGLKRHIEENGEDEYLKSLLVEHKVSIP